MRIYKKSDLANYFQNMGVFSKNKKQEKSKLLVKFYIFFRFM